MESKVYKGHRIELRARKVRELHALEAGRKPGLELLIDDKPISSGQMPDGSYFLREYAFDWSDNLMNLAERFIDYQERENKIRRKAEARGGN